MPKSTNINIINLTALSFAAICIALLNHTAAIAATSSTTTSSPASSKLTTSVTTSQTKMTSKKDDSDDKKWSAEILNRLQLPTSGNNFSWHEFTLIRNITGKFDISLWGAVEHYMYAGEPGEPNHDFKDLELSFGWTDLNLDRNKRFFFSFYPTAVFATSSFAKKTNMAVSPALQTSLLASLDRVKFKLSNSAYAFNYRSTYYTKTQENDEGEAETEEIQNDAYFFENKLEMMIRATKKLNFKFEGRVESLVTFDGGVSRTWIQRNRAGYQLAPFIATFVGIRFDKAESKKIAFYDNRNQSFECGLFWTF